VPIPVVAFAVWTLVVWGGRIRNAVADADGARPVVLAVTFVALAAAVLITRADRRAVLALAAWTVGVWVVRGVDIALLSDHDTAFVVVHLVLAVVSVALAVAATRSARARQPVAS
jgi:hypothetical protein